MVQPRRTQDIKGKGKPGIEAVRGGRSPTDSTGTASTDQLDIESVNTAMHGLKNELNRLHELHRAIPDSQSMQALKETVWTRIVVIQEALLNVVREYAEKLKKENNP